MNRAIVALLLVFVLVATAGCLEGGDEGDTGGGTGIKTVTMKGFFEIMQNQSVTNDTEAKYIYGDLPSVEENDTLVIADTVQQVAPRPSYNITQFKFASEPNASLYVEGNQSGVYAAGDDVEITFHIIEDVFQHPDQINKTGWQISIEVVQEIWSQTQHRYSPTMPADAIEKA